MDNRIQSSICRKALTKTNNFCIIFNSSCRANKPMIKEEKIKKEGMVIEALPSLHFKVKLDNGREVLAHLAGKLRIFRIKTLPGDRVVVEFTPYDENRGRIVWRGKKK